MYPSFKTWVVECPKDKEEGDKFDDWLSDSFYENSHKEDYFSFAFDEQKLDDLIAILQKLKKK